MVLVQVLSPLIVIALICIVVSAAISKTHGRVFLINTGVVVVLQMPILFFMTGGFDVGFLHRGNPLILAAIAIIILSYVASHITFSILSKR